MPDSTVFLCVDGIFRKSSAEIKMPYIPAHPISAEDAEQFLRLDINSDDKIVKSKKTIMFSLILVYFYCDDH